MRTSARRQTEGQYQCELCDAGLRHVDTYSTSNVSSLFTRRDTARETLTRRDTTQLCTQSVHAAYKNSTSWVGSSFGDIERQNQLPDQESTISPPRHLSLVLGLSFRASASAASASALLCLCLSLPWPQPQPQPTSEPQRQPWPEPTTPYEPDRPKHLRFPRPQMAGAAQEDTCLPCSSVLMGCNQYSSSCVSVAQNPFCNQGVIKRTTSQ